MSDDHSEANEAAYRAAVPTIIPILFPPHLIGFPAVGHLRIACAAAGGYPDAGIIAIVFAAASYEALLNQILVYVGAHSPGGEPLQGAFENEDRVSEGSRQRLFDRERLLGEDIKRKHLACNHKLPRRGDLLDLVALHMADKVNIRGVATFARLKTLFGCRHHLIHTQPDLVDVTYDHDTLAKSHSQAKLIGTYCKEFHVPRPPTDNPVGVVDVLRHRNAAAWAARTAVAVFEAIAEWFPHRDVLTDRFPAIRDMLAELGPSA